MLIRTRPQGRDMAQGRNNAALQSEINVQRIAWSERWCACRGGTLLAIHVTSKLFFIRWDISAIFPITALNLAVIVLTQYVFSDIMTELT